MQFPEGLENTPLKMWNFDGNFWPFEQFYWSAGNTDLTWIPFSKVSTWFTIWHYCFRIENWRVWHQFWNPRCLHGIQNSFFLWQSGTNDLSLWNQQWTISILRRKDVCKNTFRKNLWNIWRINSLDFNIYIY